MALHCMTKSEKVSTAKMEEGKGKRKKEKGKRKKEKGKRKRKKEEKTYLFHTNHGTPLSRTKSKEEVGLHCHIHHHWFEKRHHPRHISARRKEK
jgi:hypothetical protein